MTHEEFVKQLKKSISMELIPPHYSVCEPYMINCYLYALRAHIDCLDYGGLVAPGIFSREVTLDEYKFTKEYILRNFKEDCSVLNLQVFPTTVDEKINSEEYKIAIYYVEKTCDNNHGSFHFVRQNSNGNWSEKWGWFDDEIKILEEGDIAKNRAKYGVEYEFAGVFRLSKRG